MLHHLFVLTDTTTSPESLHAGEERVPRGEVRARKAAAAGGEGGEGGGELQGRDGGKAAVVEVAGSEV